MVSLKKSSQQNHVGDRTKNLFAIILSCLDAGLKPVRLQVLNVDKTFSPAPSRTARKEILFFFYYFLSNW